MRAEQNWYTVYDARTDELLACGSAAKCARTLGLTKDSFYSTLCRVAKGTNHKYLILTEDFKKEDFL